MNIYTVNHINKALILISKDLLNAKESAPRGLKTKELEDVFITFISPTIENSIPTLSSRKYNKDYLDAELKWYQSGDLHIDNIKNYSSMWERIANPDGTINSNYGYLCFKQKDKNGNNQIEWVINRLKKDNDSRQAVINYNQPMHKYEGNKDFVCTIAQQFRIKDNKLDSRVIMRSNDLIYGFSYDIPWFVWVQHNIAQELKLPVGNLIHYTMSMHVYEKHYKMLENMANGE